MFYHLKLHLHAVNRSEKLMKPQNYVEGQKFEIFPLTDLTICRSTDTCCFKSCFHEKNMCNEQPRQATENPIGGKACSSTKGGLLRYIPNTYSIHKVSSLKFAYFQDRLSHHITSPSEKTRPESWLWDYMGKATQVRQLSLSHRCHQM